MSSLNISNQAVSTCASSNLLLNMYSPLISAQHLLDVPIGPDGSARARLVRALARVAARIGPADERLLRLLLVLLLAHPRHNRRLLESLAEAERYAPRAVLEQLAHGRKVNARGLLVVLVDVELPAQEENPRHARGHGALEGLNGEPRDLLRTRLGALQPVLDHVGLENGSLQVNVVHLEALVLRGQHPLRDCSAHVDVVVPVGHDLGLNNGHEPDALADGRVPGESMHALQDRKVGRQVGRRVDLYYKHV